MIKIKSIATVTKMSIYDARKELIEACHCISNPETLKLIKQNDGYLKQTYDKYSKDFIERANYYNNGDTELMATKDMIDNSTIKEYMYYLFLIVFGLMLYDIDVCFKSIKNLFETEGIELELYKNEATGTIDINTPIGVLYVH